MNERDRERLSALMDNEAGDLELRQVLKAAEDDPALVDTWKRYHLIQSALRRDAGVWAGVDLRTSLATRLDAEDDSGASRREAFRHRRGLQALASLAVAASVALVTVFSWQSLRPDTPGMAATAPMLAHGGVQARMQTVALDPMVVVREDGEELLMTASASAPTAAQDRLNTYLARHARAAGSLASARGVATYARVVSVEGEQEP
ncbi:MAG: sigma-E factor negative regulatory protein [Gammaproteobacteria bacterium]